MDLSTQKALNASISTLSHPHRIHHIIEIKSDIPDSVFMPRISYGEGITDNIKHGGLTIFIFSLEHFVGELTVWTQKTSESHKYTVDTGSLNLFSTLKRKNDTSSNTETDEPERFPPELQMPFLVGTTQIFAGKPMTPQIKETVFGKSEPRFELLDYGGTSLSFSFFGETITPSPKEIYWDIENLGVFLSNKSQPTRIEISHPKPIKSLTVEYISKFDSFEGKKETITCTEYDKQTCIFEAPVNILKKSKAILVTIHED